MDFLNKFKSFLGIPQRQEAPNLEDSREPTTTQPPRGWHLEGYERDEGEYFGNPRNFNILTDPLEIHRYFEEQMSEMLRSFGFSEFNNDGFNHHNFGFPEIEDIPRQYEKQTGELRDQFLKPGYDKAIKAGKDKIDQDIDGRLNVEDLDSIFDRSKQHQVVPKTKTHFYGQSVTSKTIRNPDGSIEIHKTVRDNEGNEETTITKKLGDKEYSLTKRRDKDGKEERIENLVNLDKSEIDKYFPSQTRIPQLDDKPYNSWYDRFFK